MHERGKAVEVGLIECQTCEKKIYVVKKILGKFFQKYFSLNLILSYNLNYFYHFQPFSYYKKSVRLKEVIRRDFDQCDLVGLTGLDCGGVCLPVIHTVHNFLSSYLKMCIQTREQLFHGGYAGGIYVFVALTLN